MARFLAPLCAIFMILATLSGCASAAKDDPFVEPEHLGALLRSPNTLVLDVRPQADFDAKRVSSARRVDAKAWSDAAKAIGGDTDADGWSARLAAAGVTPSSSVVVYDDGRMTAAASVWFLLQHFGVQDSRILNGGFPAIEKTAAGVLTIEPPAPAAEGNFAAGVDPDARVGWASKQDVRTAMDSKSATVFDARTPDEYTGKDARGNKRTGHIPGATNLSHSDLIGADGRVRPASQIRSMLEAKGFRPGDPIILHCQSGARSSLAAAATLRAGFGPISNYYMSFAEWSADETCPLDTVAQH
jgi:thiosulfate/3-mercaptopyruvate sulfurtransferase